MRVVEDAVPGRQDAPVMSVRVRRMRDRRQHAGDAACPGPPAASAARIVGIFAGPGCV